MQLGLFSFELCDEHFCEVRLILSPTVLRRDIFTEVCAVFLDHPVSDVVLGFVLGCLRTKFQSLALRVKSLVLSTPWPCVLINIITPCTSMPSGPSITLLFCGLFHSHSPGGNTKFGRNCSSLNVTMRYDTKCYLNVRSIADMSQLKLSHGTNN